MKKPHWPLASLLAVLTAAGAALAATVTVLVQETQVRKRPQFYAPAVRAARLGEKFEATGPEEGWYKAEPGYIHQSAVTAKSVKLGSGTNVASGGATAEEITLAGKGFNSQVEKSYRAKHASANFSAVDGMESRKASDSDVLDFMRKGGLIP